MSDLDDLEREPEPTMRYRQKGAQVEYCIFPDYTMIPEGEGWEDTPARMKNKADLVEKRWSQYRMELAARAEADDAPAEDDGHARTVQVETRRRRGRSA